MKQIIKEGFSRFVGSGQVQISGGVKAHKYEQFITSLLSKIELGPKYIKYVKATLEEADYAMLMTNNGFILILCLTRMVLKIK